MSNIPADIIFFIVLAIVLLFQFNSILGGKEGKEKEKSNNNDAIMEKAKVIELLKQQQQDKNFNAKETNVLEISKEVYNDAVNNLNKTVKKGVEEISSQDSSFEVDSFIRGAITAFGLVVLAYARGNLTVLKNMLNDELFEAFKSDISKRKKKENVDTRIEKMSKINLTKAKLQGTMIYVTVKFVSEQTTAIRDDDGQVLKGDPEQTHEITDIWTFARDIRSENPNWTLVSSES